MPDEPLGTDDFRIVIETHNSEATSLLKETLDSLVEGRMIEIVSFERVSIASNSERPEETMNRTELSKLVERAPQHLKKEVKLAVDFLLSVDASSEEKTTQELTATNDKIESANLRLEQALSRSREFNKRHGFN